MHRSVGQRILWTSLLSVLLFTPASALGKGLSVESLKGASGTNYTFYANNDLKVGWKTSRPDKSDDKIKFCAPAAFTTTTGTIVGIYAQDGKVENVSRISKPIGGAMLIRDGDFTIISTNSGSIFTKSFVSSLRNEKASLFQQFQIVKDGKPTSFKDKKTSQIMRGIVKFKDGRSGVIESMTGVTHQKFNSDLAGLGVANALYTDMGGWDEGWYRDPKCADLVTIGQDRSQTDKQTNWVVFFDRR